MPKWPAGFLSLRTFEAVHHFALSIERLTPRQVQSVVRHVNDLLDGKSTKVTKNLLMATGSAITPEFLKNTRSLPDNGSKLFSRDFVDMTKNLIKKAARTRREITEPKHQF
ncbi:predicted protein [Histoplasma capsulatum G186AR]|uniref:Uncharacterized protein n=1 Tax=Ajellomyces capsulatus (strain G186AR / H82 / ATCC MYA-2454 / RMSCC 2432) TaxID=447093 RepID=C0NUC2_AJECG|nr:uncharacterized protein HCBG_06953 [Histoplasma capsulatum G186AR]EEH05002.1 predicted protein [Histoplasma capsulatum G186AR]